MFVTHDVTHYSLDGSTLFVGHPGEQHNGVFPLTRDPYPLPPSPDPTPEPSPPQEEDDPSGTSDTLIQNLDRGIGGARPSNDAHFTNAGLASDSVSTTFQDSHFSLISTGDDRSFGLVPKDKTFTNL